MEELPDHVRFQPTSLSKPGHGLPHVFADLELAIAYRLCRSRAVVCATLSRRDLAEANQLLSP